MTIKNKKQEEPTGEKQDEEELFKKLLEMKRMNKSDDDSEDFIEATLNQVK